MKNSMLDDFCANVLKQCFGCVIDELSELCFAHLVVFRTGKKCTFQYRTRSNDALGSAGDISFLFSLSVFFNLL